MLFIFFSVNRIDEVCSDTAFFLLLPKHMNCRLQLSSSDYVGVPVIM